MSLIFLLLFLIQFILAQGKRVVCFKPLKFKVDTNDNYISIFFVNHTNLHPVTLYATFDTTRIMNRPSAKIVVTYYSKRGKDVFMNKEVDICEIFSKDKTNDFIFQYIFGAVYKAAKEFNPCPLQPGTYTLPELVFSAKTWIPRFSGGSANIKLSFYTKEDLKKVWTATVDMRAYFVKANAAGECPKP